MLSVQLWAVAQISWCFVSLGKITGGLEAANRRFLSAITTLE